MLSRGSNRWSRWAPLGAQAIPTSSAARWIWQPHATRGLLAAHTVHGAWASQLSAGVIWQRRHTRGAFNGGAPLVPTGEPVRLEAGALALPHECEVCCWMCVIGGIGVARGRAASLTSTSQHVFLSSYTVTRGSKPILRELIYVIKVYEGQ